MEDEALVDNIQVATAFFFLLCTGKWTSVIFAKVAFGEDEVCREEKKEEEEEMFHVSYDVSV